MQELSIWIVVLGLIGVMFWGLARENRQRKNRTPQRFEREVAASRDSLMRAGMLELDKFVGQSNQKQAAVEYLKDEDQGMTKAGGKDDDAGRTEGKQ